MLVPPEIIELDSISADSGEEAPLKQEEWPEFYVRLFPEDVSRFSSKHHTLETLLDS